MNCRNGLFVLAAILSVTSGCSMPAAPGSEAAARQYFAREFEKWMAGQPTDVSTMEFRIRGLQKPISYDLRSIVPDKPDPMAFDLSRGIPENTDSWPAWRLNTVIEWKSEAGTPVQKVSAYTLTWNPDEQKWYVNERDR